MWDKAVGYIITEIKDQIPSDFTIDETRDDNDQSLISTPAFGITKDIPATENKTHNRDFSFEENFSGLVRTITKDFNAGSNIPETISCHKHIIDIIEKTNCQIKGFEDSYEVEKNKKRLVMQKFGKDSKKVVDSLDKMIFNKIMRNTLEISLKGYEKHMREMMGVEEVEISDSEGRMI